MLLKAELHFDDFNYYRVLMAKHGQSGGNKCKPLFSYSTMSVEQKKHGLQESI